MVSLQALWDLVQPVRANVAGAPVQRRLARIWSPTTEWNWDKDPFPALVAGDEFLPGGSYFGVRLAGLNLARARRFATKSLPLCVCLAEFGRPGAERSVPFSIGPDVIRQHLKSAGISDAAGADQAWIEFRDLTVLRPTPVRIGNLSLFVGLYAVPGDEPVKHNRRNVMGISWFVLGRRGGHRLLRRRRRCTPVLARCWGSTRSNRRLKRSTGAHFPAQGAATSSWRVYRRMLLRNGTCA